MTQDDLKLVLEALKWCHGGEPCGTGEAIVVVEKALAQTQEPQPKEDGLYAVYFLNNWDGQENTEYVFARLEKGVWVTHETGEPLHTFEGDKIIAAWSLNDASAQREQEPVMWMCRAFDGEVCEQSNHDECENPIPLYTALPQRTWVGLTGEEAMDVTRKEGHELLDFIYEYGTGSEGVEERIVAICKAIEAKLKEKNT